MNGRRYGSKPTLAFWTLIATADTVTLGATAGVLVLLVVLACLGLAAGLVVAWLRSRRPTSAPNPVARRAPREMPMARTGMARTGMARTGMAKTGMAKTGMAKTGMATHA